jgi:hypothetical protein
VCQLQGSRSRQKRSLLIVNEYFGGKRNEASGDNVTLLTDDTLEQLNDIIVKFGHIIFKKKEETI